MAEQFSAEWARSVIDNGTEKARSFIDDPSKLDGLFEQLTEKLKGLPATVAESFANVPLMISMVKSYITKEYTEVSPKVVISLIAAFLYLVKPRDLIPDYIPVVGLLDDIAVVAAVLALNKPELEAYAQWRERKEKADAWVIDPDSAPEIL